jgi:TolB-like protein
LRSRANQRAQDALARESELAAQTGDPQTLAVLPIDIAGDSSYQPLSRGLAEMITADLALLEQFRLVERMQVNALIDEMRLAQSSQVDAGTAARMGRLLQAGRMVQGLAQIPGDQDVRLEASVIRADGQVLTAGSQTGRLRDLLRMEKDVVVSIAGQLGYVLSEAERQMILENGTQNLAAFLAYSRGLEAEDLGDYSAAAAHFSNAVRQDPGFTSARTNYSATASAASAEQAAPADVTTVASEPPQSEAAGTADVTQGASQSTVIELTGTQAEQATAAVATTATTTEGSGSGSGGAEGSTTTISNPTPVITTTVPTTTVTGTTRIVFPLP